MNNNLNKDLNIAGRLSLVFINHPLTFIFGVFILALGYISLLIMPREENPQIKVSGGVVIVALPEGSPSEIQKVIIEPLEKKIKEIKGVENIYSYAKDSVGIVQVQYFIGQDKEASNLKLYDQVMRNMDLMPQNAMQPIIKTMDIDTDIPIATIAFYSDKENDKDLISQTQLYNEINKITKELNKIKDVALVDLKGEKKEQFNVMVDANKLSSYNLSLGQVMKQIQGLSYKTPNITTNTQNSSIVVFGIKQAVENVKDLENLIISYNFQTPIYLKDIAKIEKSYDIQNKKEALIYLRDVIEDFEETNQITLSASKLKGGNSVTINKEIFEYMDSIKDDLLAKKIKYTITRDDGYTANNAVNELVSNLLISIVIIAILLIFTLGLKEAMIVSLMVPMILSLTLFTGLVINESINRITLFALIVSLGMLVDAAIIVIENIHRHKLESPHLDISIVSINATNEIGNATNIATIAIIMTFIPMFFVGGMMGQFMHPLPVFVPISLAMSLFVAYAFTPYLVKKFL
ncbi:RND family efflux system, inner membrane transporter, AcrB family [Arcobacter venerupis]|uniref:RND family efflux system, inner membrane transporter, AcrB family n=1 Tax=Arcobacter venerupis TaxID=1054033 RepID=A0AAE7E3L6_9BACT|nr:efflux RND transporter permease subunit [Arcobacter venerupis]QKF67388.1 RND family efflux system, inner membrane transporter, AcrB family [Arcobacter venerupis]RWS50597.1 multidrug transporter AcrB [Arcobacter venerupis]